MKILKKYAWPGNVRELENLIERAVILSKEEYLNENHFPQDIQLAIDKNDETIMPLDNVVKNYIKRIYLLTGKNKYQTAQLLKISRKTLDRKLKDIGI